MLCFFVTETLLNAVQDIYKKLVRSSDGEKFYSTFYGNVSNQINTLKMIFLTNQILDI